MSIVTWSEDFWQWLMWWRTLVNDSIIFENLLKFCWFVEANFSSNVLDSGCMIMIKVLIESSQFINECQDGY